MRDKPNGQDLDALASTLGATGALADRCRMIAQREAGGDEAFAGVRAALQARYGAQEDSALLVRLAAEIRAGALDEGSAVRAALGALLLAITRAKLAESNPAYLEEA